MRKLLPFVALLPLAANAADDPGDALESESTAVVVTALRTRSDPLTTPASISRIDSQTLLELSAKHQADTLNSVPGVYIQRGSGSESLGAIRSPVLAGAGACGAFLIAEDSLPIRPVGFCNLNEMFELNYEQAGSIEVLRGPGSSMFGASAVHGIVNVRTPDVDRLPDFAAGLETGSDAFKRLRLTGSGALGPMNLGAYGTATRAPGWRDASGVDEAKLNLLADTGFEDGSQLRVRAAGSVLNQETAGFIQGFNSYRDEDIARTNPNPEAFRDASSARVSVRYDKDDAFTDGGSLQIAAMYRRSRMDFLQHFLIGKPLEHNAQTSYLLSGTAAIPFGDFTARFAIDTEQAQSELTEFQPGPSTDGAPAANAIRPQGFHYDYRVDSWTLGETTALDWRITGELTATVALRADRTNYDYDNRMIDGNTADNGVPCAAGGCLYARPADRVDHFSNVSPGIALGWKPGWQMSKHFFYLNASTGFRPPEMTELYRLQRQQTEADLNSEHLEAVELGWKYADGNYRVTTALFAMSKRDLILRETNGFNVSNGSSRHAGLEYEVRREFDQRARLSLAGTVARHQYTFSRAVEGGETIVDGNDIDTAPRNLHTLSAEVALGRTSHQPTWRLGADATYVGKYFLDAANTATYPGHTVVNLRLDWSPVPVRVALHVDNLFDKRYADRADFAFGNYRYFPARGRAVFLSIDYASN
jgi:outer membrane receptor protein involved in Fe transport